MLAVLGALAIGLSLGLLGSGGSILTVPVLVYLVGEPEKLAITESLGIVAAIALVGAISHGRARHIDWRMVTLVGPTAMVGSYLGAWISQFMSGELQMLLFAAVMLLAAWRMYRNARNSEELHPAHCRPGCLLGIGVGLGLMSGLVGVGGGFLIVPALVLLGGLTMTMAVGTSLAIILMSAVTGFAKHLHQLHLQNLQPNWRVLLLFAALGILGSLMSRLIGHRLSQTRLQLGYSLMVSVIAGGILCEFAAGRL